MISKVEIELEKEENSQQAEVYTETNITNDLYTELHEIYNVILESQQKLELISKLLFLCNLIQKNACSNERMTTIIMMRIRGHTLPEIAEKVDICPQQVSKILQKIDDDKLISLFKHISKQNHQLYSGTQKRDVE